MIDVNKKLAELDIVIPAVPKPVAAYIPAVRTGNHVYVSGQDCRRDGVLIQEGKVGSDLTVEQGYQAARQCMINILAVLQDQLGDLNKVKRFVKILGFVNSTDDFTEQPFVINGASELLIEIFAEKGRHARSAVGSNSLPFNTPVEIEAIVECE